MEAWFLVVLFYSNPNAKVAVYQTEAECKKYMPVAIKELKDNKDVKSISCMEGSLKKENTSKDINV